MNTNWKQARKELKDLGIVVKTSFKACCLGCVEEKDQIPNDVPALYQLSKRFSGQEGGYLCHQNIGDTTMALKIMQTLSKNQIKWEWDGSQARSLYVEFPDEGI